MPLPVRTSRRVAVCSLAVVLALLSVVLSAPRIAVAAPVNGTALLNEDFGGTTVANPAIRALDDACLTRSTTLQSATDPSVSNLSKCTRTTRAPGTGANPGYLQLTDNENNRRGGIVFNQALPGNAGIQIEFSQYQYGPDRNGADGITFFLVDGAVNLDSTGAYGGSLGYAQRNNELGVNGGYLGVGLDAYGNFANDSESRGRGCPSGQHSPVRGTTLIPNSVVIRGPQAANDPSRRNGYCYLAGTLNSSATRTTLPGSLRASSLDSARRDVRITVSEDQFPTVTVEIDFRDGRGYQNVLNYKMTTPAPATWKFGLASSTGGSKDTHLIRTVKVQTVVPLNAINLVKQVDRTQQQPATYAAGDTIPYQFVVTNAEANPLHDVVVTDPKISGIVCPRTTLGPAGFPDATMTCTGSYRLQPGDTDTETTFTNTALARGKTVGGETVQKTSTVTVPLTPKPDLTIDKTATLADTNGNNLADVGEQITYAFAVRNTGNFPLTGVAIADTRATGLSCADTSLDPGQTTTCSAAPYTVTQADVDAGKPIHNSATVVGTPPGGPLIVRGPSTTDVPVAASAPKLTLVKTAQLNDTNANGVADVGETISYGFVATNAGNVTLQGLAISDPKVGAVTCPSTTLAPGQSVACTAVAYTVTQADADAGGIANSATGTATPPGGTPITTQGHSNVPTQPSVPVITVEKTAVVTDVNSNGLTDVGDTIAYSFLVANRGNVSLTSVSVTDAKAGPVSCPQQTLAPQTTTTCTADTVYVITAADADTGAVDNTATAVGTPPGGSTTTGNDTHRVPTIKPLPRLTIAKTATLNDTNSNGLADLGETIDYGFVVRNTGNVVLTGISVSDPKAGAVTCVATTLQPGASTTCSAAPYSVTQADVDSGAVQNSATATGIPPGTSTPIPSEPGNTTTPALKPNPGVAVQKSAVLGDTNGNNLADVGETITYSFVVRNTGNVTLTGVAVTDAKAGPVTCPATTLTPGQATTCTASVHTVTQAEVDAGSIDNSATATGVPPGGGTITSPPDLVRTPAATPNPSLVLKKLATLNDANSSGVAELGETITYTFEVRNTGNVTLTGVAVADPKAGTVSCPATPLAPGAATTCTAAPYTVTQDDVDLGAVANTATATATPPAGGTTTSRPAKRSVPVKTQAPALTLTKTATLTDGNNNGVADVGEEIVYTFVATNAGDVTLTSVAVTDTKAGPVSCDQTTLAPGASTNCQATSAYTVTQADVNAGVVDNRAFATAQPPGNNDPVESNHPRAQVPVPSPRPLLALVKSARLDDGNSNGLADVGETIAYSFEVTNVGNVTMTDIQVDDPDAGPVTCTPTTLAPGASASCDADDDYTVTQDDVDRGYILNLATASGQPPTGGRIPSPESGTLVPASTPQPLLTLLKKGALVSDANGIADVGDRIRYTFLVTNAGNVTMDAVSVDDAKAGSITCPDTTLAPGASTTCEADSLYTVTQADVDAGVVSNVAQAGGTTPGSVRVPSNASRVRIGTTLPSPGLFLAKTAQLNDTNNNGTADVGETVGYGFQVRNTGTVTITGLAIDDPDAGSVTCAATTLAPGATTTCTADTPRSVTQDELDEGHVDNTATATGTPPGGGTVPSNPSTTELKTTPEWPGLVAEKTATLLDTNGNSLGDVGEQIEYTFTLTNSGNVTLTGVTVDDPDAGAVTCSPTTLAPGAVATCSANSRHTITQDDVDNGSVDNTARGQGVPPSGGVFTGPPTGTSVPGTPQTPGLTVVKTHTLNDTNSNGSADAGETVQYGFTVTNSGNVTITGVGVDDPTAGPVTCAPTTLAPTEQSTCTADDLYTITQADLDRGYATNTATGTGTPPTGPDTISPPTTHHVPTTPAEPALTIVKTATLVDDNGNGLADVGEVIEYRFRVVNTGNITLDAIAVDDPTAGTVTCSPTTLAPGEDADCTAADHTVTQTDVDRGYVENTATATGRTPGDREVTTPPDTRRVPTVRPVPAITLVKNATLVDVVGGTSGLADVGEPIEYTFTVTNVGNVTLTSVAVDDPKLGTIECAADTLAPGASTTCTPVSAPGVPTTYTVTQADVDAGVVLNTATGTGEPPTGTPVTSTSQHRVPTVQQRPLLAVQKTATLVDSNSNGLGDVGEQIIYGFTVRNTGNVSLTGVQVDDPLAGPVTCSPTTLAPGESAACVASSMYTITQDDVDAGGVTNSATATGVPPGGERTPPSLPGRTTTPTVPEAPELALAKRASLNDTNGNGVADLGETVDYTFTVTNTGNVTVTGVAVDDPKIGAVSCPSGPLAPGATRDCTGSYTVVQADLDAGAVDNSATATGTPPTGPGIISPPTTERVPTPVRDPGLSVVKRAQLIDANGNGWADAGETVRYRFTITNIGNVTMSDVQLVDDSLNGVSCDQTTLAPAPTPNQIGLGQTATCGPVDYTVTQADVDLGYVHNSATATGQPPTGTRVPSQPWTTDIPSLRTRSGLGLIKRSHLNDTNGNHTADAGETISYSFRVWNSGNTTIRDIEVVDALIGPVTCPRTTLPPYGADSVMTCTADRTYTVTTADVRAGKVVNVATARGRTPNGRRVTSPPDTATTITTRTGPPRRPDHRLARTGVDGPVLLLGLIGAGLSAAGGAVLGVERRRRRA